MTTTTVTTSDRWKYFYHEHCTYLPAMLGWFLFSSVLSSYNKILFGEKHMNFPCPLLMTSIHFLCQWIFSVMACAFFPGCTGGERVSGMSWKEWICVSIPCGIVTSGDIGLSNLSMVTISITFYTMCKASTPIFVLFWAYLFGIERITLSLIGVVLVITCGEFLTVIGEVDFDLKGFVLCISAAILSGARWTLIQLKLQTMEPPIKSTIATMKLLAPSMFFTLLSISFAIETPWVKLGHYTMDEWLHTIELGTVGAFIAISMILCEFYLILYASAMILMIGGVIKEMITIIIGVTYFGDSLNSINVAGCVIVFLGVILYKATRMYDKTQNHNLSSTIDEDEYEVVGSRNPPESPNNNANDDLELTFSSDSFDSQGSATRSRFRQPSISPILSEDPSESEPLQSSPNGQSSSSPVSNDLNDNEDEIQRSELKIV